MASSTIYDVGNASATATNTISISGTYGLPGHRWSTLLIAIMYDVDYIFGTVNQVMVQFGGGDVPANFVVLGTGALSSQTIELWELNLGSLGGSTLPAETNWQGLTATLDFSVGNLIAIAFGVSFCGDGFGTGISQLSSTDGTTSPITSDITGAILGGEKFTINVDPADSMQLTFASVENPSTVTISNGTELTRQTSGSAFLGLVGYNLPIQAGTNTVSWTTSTSDDWLVVSATIQAPTITSLIKSGNTSSIHIY